MPPPSELTTTSDTCWVPSTKVLVPCAMCPHLETRHHWRYLGACGNLLHRSRRGTPAQRIVAWMKVMFRQTLLIQPSGTESSDYGKTRQTGYQPWGRDFGSNITTLIMSLRPSSLQPTKRWDGPPLLPKQVCHAITINTLVSRKATAWSP